jgi:hypothetical protein
MRLQSKHKRPKAVSLSVMLLLIWTVAGSNLHSTSASAQTSQTIVLKSGNGPVGSQDPVNQCAIDGNGTYQDACIVDPHPAYSVIPGTQYISSTPDSSTPVDGATRYRAIFQLPEGFSSPSMDGQVLLMASRSTSRHLLIFGLTFRGPRLPSLSAMLHCFIQAQTHLNLKSTTL